MQEHALLLAAGMMLLAAPAWPREPAIWVTAYYAGWRQAKLPPGEIDYGALTHLAHFAVSPRADGTLDADINLLGPRNAGAAVREAHKAGKKAIFTVGGEGTRSRFLGAMSDEHRAAFIGNLVGFMSANGYDGIDVDMEEILPADGPAFSRFIRELRGKLDEIKPRPLLTAAVLWEPALFAQLASQFDQINIMTYNLAGAYPGWVAWHSGAIYDGGYRFPDGGRPLPSVEGQVDAFIAAGVPKKKLGIGLCFYGYVWKGVSQPRQGWKAAPTVSDMPYFALADAYGLREYDYSNPNYHWDAKAQAAYLAISDDGDDRFVSYDNEVTAAKKVRYVREKGLGGLIIWELGGGYRAARPEGERDVLLQAVKNAVTAPR